jgi:hypothetical protein
MSSRLRDEQETRNAAEVMDWVRHLADHVEVLEAYIAALRQTDRGDLDGWIRFFAQAVRDSLRLAAV